MINVKMINIREIQIDDLKEVAQIHEASFRSSALSHLGVEAIFRQYYWLLTGPHDVIPQCAETESGQIVGYIFAGNFYGALSGFLMKNKWFLIRRVAFHPLLLFNPIVYKQAKIALKILYAYLKKPKISSNLTNHPHKEVEDIRSIRVLSVAVNPLFQQKGIGELLMMEVEIIAISGGVTEMGLTVHPNNLPAIRFYEKLGWKKENSDQFWNGRMKKRLL